MPYMPEQKPRTSLPFIVHQGDLMAARIEWEREWLPRLKGDKKSLDAGKKNFTLGENKKAPSKDRALSSIKSEGLKNMLDSL
jgi:hypothetical protein